MVVAIVFQKNLFGHDKSRFYTSKIYFNLGEVALVNKLNKTVAKFPQVTFGSYPELFHRFCCCYVSDTISAPWMYVNRLSPPILSLFNNALDTLEQLFRKIQVMIFKPEEVCLCYNGGKDCLVALHITHAYMSKHFPDKRIQAVYITEKNAFPYVTEFVHESINRYDLDCEIVPGPMKTALSSLLVNRPSIKAVIMGTRRVDPSGESLDVFSPTDGDWPPLMRVNPILEWKYDEIWSFIRQLYLPYCSLYDRGYTSLGSLDNTLPNPALERRDALGRVTYLPAYHLGDANLERKGRVF
ncbi:FAD synthase [Armadillidium vulgare]|nr:FAD synthase [Armadillidium vulgare]